MRKIVCSVFALCCCSLVLAQEKTRSLSVELLGAQNVVGVNYDSRFKGNSGWGYRVGIGYGYGDNSSWIDQKISGVGVPLELNYLLGEKKSKLEVGFGASLGMYHVKETSWFYSQPVPPETEGIAEPYESKENRFGYFLFGNIGYRSHQKHKPRSLRQPSYPSLPAYQRFYVSRRLIAVVQLRR